MIDSLFFDTDCLSAFLWVHNESLLPKLYPGKIVIPKPVYVEFCRPSISHLKARIDTMLENGEVVIQDIIVGTNEFSTYYQLTELPADGHKTIGKGEAASIALAKEKGGIVASNNFRDIDIYVKEFELEHTTTSDILTDAYKRGLITETEGNSIWAAMVAKRRRLGASSFSEYLLSKQKG
ncbi:MAG: hypothetical protein PHG19_02035 [Anaerotignum sp.]|nr:hypothetical protein [Anaerotignum sp.]